MIDADVLDRRGRGRAPGWLASGRRRLASAPVERRAAQSAAVGRTL
ncbi:hypothetical protein [Micromonospora sp. CPCC 206061]